MRILEKMYKSSKECPMKHEISFYSEGMLVAADLYMPENIKEGAVLPAIVLCHGFAGIKEILLPDYAELFCSKGYIALVFDYRGFGKSEGERGRLVPIEQISDVRNAITYIGSLPEVDSGKIGLWGSSFGGANVISAAAIDVRVKCIVAQLTFGDGERVITGNMNADERAKLMGMLLKAQERQVLKNKPLLLSPDQILTDNDSKNFYNNALEQYPELKTKLPITILQNIIEYKPEDYIARSNVPVLLIAAEYDTACPCKESTYLYEKAIAPKQLFIMERTRHYDVYAGENFIVSSGKALEWFEQYLK
ncbi:MAG: hypothetical protein DKM50_13260 [Candidatus Margulisiibacteriota bacterium]|nr:MAG: hypothetical protein DKM50_13260 [Candidatus Margulisiibacteriota bacterium]HAR64481.1 hypothetical protein [Candidatus Margulisiibacteriota bacterium]HCY37723.1 hypothetical protein [Candidatus Margulisiibacteriota bacterium]